MRGIGTVVNVVTVLAGTALGLVAGSRLPERLRSTVLSGVGLLTFVIGIQQATETRNVVFPLVALIIGAIAGELLGIEERLEAVGDRIRRRVEGSGAEDQATTTRFVEGFVAASLLFCVGPLTILGSIEDGLGGPDHAQLLFVKSALDGLVAVVFASTLGWGVGFSALTIMVVQGTLTLAAGAADRVLTARMIDEMTATGGVMILGIGLQLLDLKRVRVASFLPALVVAPIAVALFAR
ncbi:MAG: DUF554 domain-containing protein [Actinomycetota bacterium]|nr:DUF554 domain-containing protein [Actinomycetota bacterium]